MYFKKCLSNAKHILVMHVFLKRACLGSAGYDLWAAEAKVLKPWSRELTRLYLFMVTPEGYYGRTVRCSS